MCEHKVKLFIFEPMKQKRRKYDKEFKIRIVNLYLSGRKSLDVAREMELDSSMVRCRVREYGVYEKSSFHVKAFLFCGKNKHC